MSVMAIQRQLRACVPCDYRRELAFIGRTGVQSNRGAHMRALRSRGRWPKSVATISLLATILVAFAASTAQNGKKPSSRSAAVKTESYPVYSALLTQHYREWFRKNTSIQIAAYTTPPDRSHGYMARCSAGADDETDRELIQQLLSQGDQKEKLEAKLELPGQYVFVQGKPNIRKGVEPGIVTLSSVVFSKDGKRAMVWVGNSCGSLCGSGMMWRLDKTPEGWRVTHYVPSCGFIS